MGGRPVAVGGLGLAPREIVVEDGMGPWSRGNKVRDGIGIWGERACFFFCFGWEDILVLS